MESVDVDMETMDGERETGRTPERGCHGFMGPRLVSTKSEWRNEKESLFDPH